MIRFTANSSFHANSFSSSSSSSQGSVVDISSPTNLDIHADFILPKNGHDHRNLAVKLPNRNLEVRPVIYTFYARIDPEKHVRYTGMSDSADRLMLQHWERYWRKVGWEPKILTMDDARRHPQFERFDEALDLDKINFGIYDKLCMLRWLAIAAVGGGFLADYDVFPIRNVNYDGIKLPYNGKLTVYEQALNGGIPCLISGTYQEYDRVSELILESTLTRGVNEPFWSEMLALFDIYRNDPEAFLTKQGVLRGEKALDSDRKFPHEDDCWKLAKNHWVVHFSHDAILHAKDHGNIPKASTFNSRPDVLEGFLNQWSNRCKVVKESTLGMDELKG